ncbi:MAG: four helix bundle protein [Ruminococcaceae bacterium]|nr:four helix bundle protein [Oscillospiraceae bacterium]
MADSPLIIKSKEFALLIIKVCNHIKQTKRESVLTNQLIRSGTSIGANIREAFYGHGRADFIAKLQIALKECSESEYWLELLIESGYYEDKGVLDKCIEVKKLLIASINTAKENAKQINPTNS